MNYAEYITASLAKGTLGANISVGIFALIGVCAVLGGYYGAMRGFSKAVIRFFTVGASAICALLAVKTASGMIVKSAQGAEGEIESVFDLFTKYFPAFVDAVPNLFKTVLKEISAHSATIFVMMIVAVLLSPILFITFFYVLRFITIFVYELLSGLAGAISYGKGPISTILGCAVGAAQGVLIAAVILIPVSGVCRVAMDAREPLIENQENPNSYLVSAYEVLDDVADNPIFDLIEQFGGNAVYDSMITVTISDKEYNMGDECVDAIRVVADLLPIVTSEFNWKNPTDAQKAALSQVVKDIGNDELIASLTADMMRGIAACIRGNVIDLGIEGASQKLLNDAMYMFVTATRDTVEGDLGLFVDIYFIMCDRNLISAYASGNPDDIRNVLTVKDENGLTAAEEIIEKLNSYDRAAHIIASFTKLSISTIMSSAGFDQNTEELYENVKESITTVLNHNKSDFETEEEYKQAVYDDLDKALSDNNLVIEEEVKQSMVDYIADNYGDHEGEITDKEINDALLSYYKSYSDNKDTIDNILGGGDITEEDKDQLEDILGGGNKDELEDILGGNTETEEPAPEEDPALAA